MQQGKKLLLFLRRRFECGDAVGQRKPELGRLSFSSISQIYIAEYASVSVSILNAPESSSSTSAKEKPHRETAQPIKRILIFLTTTAIRRR